MTKFGAIQLRARRDAVDGLDLIKLDGLHLGAFQQTEEAPVLRMCRLAPLPS